jgi:uncharacterized protein YukE
MGGKYPALGFDPAPGNLTTITDLADSMETIAEQLGEAHTDLTRIGKSDGIWRGDAAQAFAETVEDLPEYLDKAHGSFTDAATALAGWAADVESMQRKAVDFEEEAAKALADLKSAQANPDLGLAGQSFQTGPELQQAQAALDRAEQAVAKAGEKLEQIRQDAGNLLKQHLYEGAKVAAALNKAREAAPDAPLIDIGGMLDAIGDALSSIADTLAAIGDVLSDLSTVLGVLAILTAPFQPVGAIFAVAAGATAAAAVGTKGLAKAGGADVSWAGMAGDAIGAIPLVGGFAKGAKVATSATKGIGATRSAVRGYAQTRAAHIGGEVIENAGKHSLRPTSQIVREGAENSLLKGNARLAGEAAYQSYRSGRVVGTRGLNKIMDLMGKPPVIDPLSGGGRALDASLKVGTKAGTEAYQATTD